MTPARTAEKKQKMRFSKKHLIYCYMTLFTAILFFKNSELAADWVKSGLSLCATKLIPSLFPFMVISSLIVACGTPGTVFRVLSAPIARLFGISADGCAAMLIGWLCGFPVGAKCACGLYGEGRISNGEYTRLLCITGTPSPAFLIGTVGASMLGSTKEGTALYFISIGASALIGMAMRLALGDESSRITSTPSKSNAVPIFDALTHAVCDSALGMLNICAFVVFFSAFLGTLGGVLSPLGAPPILSALIFCFFELTTGVSRVCSMSTPLTLPLTALGIGWSGISVHLQTMSICHQSKISFAPYFISHAAKSLICFVAALILL